MEIRQDAAPDPTTDQDVSRRERERLYRRSLMLDAALSVFAEKGYEDATLEEIAQRAEFGKGTLYNYFAGGKEEILFAIFDDVYDELTALIARTFSPALIDTRPSRAVFEGFLVAIFTFFQERQDQFMILIKEGQRMIFSDQSEKAVYFQEQSERLVRALVPGIEAAMAKGDLRTLPPIAIAHMIMGNVKGYQMHMTMEECRCGLEARKTVHEDGEGPDSRRHQRIVEAQKAGAQGGPSTWTPPTPQQSAQFLSTVLLDGLIPRS